MLHPENARQSDRSIEKGIFLHSNSTTSGLIVDATLDNEYSQGSLQNLDGLDCRFLGRIASKEQLPEGWVIEDILLRNVEK